MKILSIFLLVCGMLAMAQGGETGKPNPAPSASPAPPSAAPAPPTSAPVPPPPPTPPPSPAPPVLDPIPEAPKGEALLKADLERLVDRLMATQSLESFDAREELLEIGRPAVDTLLKAAKDKRPELRHLACELLGEIRDAKAQPTLLEALKDKDEFGTSVASVAARALGRLGERSVISALIKSLESPDRDLRYEAARSLGILRASEAAAPLRKLLKDKGETAHKRLIHCAAAEALGRLRDRDALDDLAGLLGDKSQERHTERSVMLYAALAMERIVGQSKGNLRGSAKESEDAIKAWTEWWAKRKAAMAPAPTPAAVPVPAAVSPGSKPPSGSPPPPKQAPPTPKSEKK